MQTDVLSSFCCMRHGALGPLEYGKAEEKRRTTKLTARASATAMAKRNEVVDSIVARHDNAQNGGWSIVDPVLLKQNMIPSGGCGSVAQAQAQAQWFSCSAAQLRTALVRWSSWCRRCSAVSAALDTQRASAFCPRRGRAGETEISRAGIPLFCRRACV